MYSASGRCTNYPIPNNTQRPNAAFDEALQDAAAFVPKAMELHWPIDRSIIAVSSHCAEPWPATIEWLGSDDK